MDPAAGVEGEVLCAGQLGDRDEVAGDDASCYNFPRWRRQLRGGWKGRHTKLGPAREQKDQTSSGYPAATAQGSRGGGRQQGWLEPWGPHRGVE